MKKWAILAAMLSLGCVRADAAAVAPVVPSQLQIPATGADFNAVINAINAILSPLTGGPGAAGTGVNGISLTPAATGGIATITLTPTADANASIGIKPNGTGNIVLFTSGPGPQGVLQFANSSAFVPVGGLAACPAVPAGRPPLGVSGVITGYLPVRDWLNRGFALVAC